MSRRPVAVTLALLCGLVVLLRLHTHAEPLGRDVATYSVIAREMRHGRDLYTDLWDNKPPVLYVVFAAAQVAAGDGAASVTLIGVLAACLTLMALYAAGGAAKDPGAALWAAAFWALISADLPLQANEPNIELLLNASLAAGFALLVRLSGTSGYGPVLGAAACLAVASLLKPVSLPVVAALAGAHAIVPPEGMRRRRVIGQALFVVAVIALAWLAVGGYFAATGRWKAYWDTVFVSNRHYAGDPLANLREGFRPARLFPSALVDTRPLWVAAAGGAVVMALRRRISRPVVLLVAWLAATPLAVAAPGKFYPHYYQLWLPPLCLAAAWAVAAAASAVRRPRLATAVLGGTVAVALALAQRTAFAMSPEAWSEAKYGDVFLRAREVARELDTMIAPDETFYQWGNEPELYVYTGRRPPAGVLWAQHLQHGPLRIGLRVRTHTQLSLADPPLVVWSRDQPPLPGALGRWFEERYEPHPIVRRRAGFSFWVRRGGKLHRRLTQ